MAHNCLCNLRVDISIELMKEKDEPKQGHGPKEFDNLGKTVGLLLHLTKPIWGTAKVVVLDSGFCVLKGLIELKKKGTLAAALIKKRRYWPKYIPAGDKIIKHFKNKEVGYVDALPGMLDNVPFHVFGMKEPDYVMQLMSTYGTNEQDGDMKKECTKLMMVRFVRLCSNIQRWFAIIIITGILLMIKMQKDIHQSPRGNMENKMVATPCVCIPARRHRSESDACISSLWRLPGHQHVEFPKGGTVS
jgi:Transposase IS4